MSFTLPGTFTFQIKNQFPAGTDKVYAIVTGYDLNNNNALYLLQSDGKTIYHPKSPDPNHFNVPIETPIAIPLNASGGPAVNVTIPKTVVGRVYISVKNSLNFYLNPGPNLVEPSVSNPTFDPINYNTQWGFCEVTYDNTQLFGNITYVDFIGLPIAMDLVDQSNTKQQVKGIPSKGIGTIANQLIQQAEKNGPWDQCVIKDTQGSILRILSPNDLIKLKPTANLFKGYYDDYVALVWQKFTGNSITIETQNVWGDISGRVNPANDKMTFIGGKWEFGRPDAAAIFNCSETPFVTSNDQVGNMSARLAAAFNRTTMLLSNTQPNGVTKDQYYLKNPTNHYSRILHDVNVDHLGYAFPYDDVKPDGATSQAGEVASPNPESFAIIVGGTQNDKQAIRKHGL